MTTNGIYHTLVAQLDKLARHNRQGSFRTKDRYYEAVKRFCAYLATHYHLQKLENINGKHLVWLAAMTRDNVIGLSLHSNHLTQKGIAVHRQSQMVQ